MLVVISSWTIFFAFGTEGLWLAVPLHFDRIGCGAQQNLDSSVDLVFVGPLHVETGDVRKKGKTSNGVVPPVGRGFGISACPIFGCSPQGPSSLR